MTLVPLRIVPFRTPPYSRPAVDSAARAALYSQLVQNAIATRNECREKEGLPPMEGGDILTVLISINDKAKLKNENDTSRTGKRTWGLSGAFDVGAGQAAPAGPEPEAVTRPARLAHPEPQQGRAVNAQPPQADGPRR